MGQSALPSRFRDQGVGLRAAPLLGDAGRGRTVPWASDHEKKAVGDQLAPKYERGMSKYPLGQYRDRVGTNVEMVYRKVVKKA